MTDTKKVRKMLDDTITKLAAKIKQSQEEKKLPADYSLGFINGLIFMQHQLDGKLGAPQFFNREMSIGVLPVPVALRTPDEIAEHYLTPEQREHNLLQNFLESSVITQARGLTVSLDKIQAHEKAHPGAEPPLPLAREFSVGLAAVRVAVRELETHMGEDDDGSAIKENLKVEPVAHEGAEQRLS